MPVTYKLIASVTVGSGGAADIEFTSIPATFDDIVIKFSGRSARSAQSTNFVIQFNNDTGSNQYRYLYIRGNGSSANSYGQLDTSIDAQHIPAATSTANTFGNYEIYIPNYDGSTAKSVSIDGVQEDNAATTVYASLVAGSWVGTSAITSVKLIPNLGNFVQHSTATLYGIKKS